MFKNNERGTASILEYTIVLPLCLVAVGMVFLMGFYLCHYAIINAAAYRAVLILQIAYEDGNYLEIADLGSHSLHETDYVGVRQRKDLYGKMECKLYRFIMDRDGYRAAKEAASEKAGAIIEKTGFLKSGLVIGQPDISVRTDVAGLSRIAHVEIKQPVGIPVILGIRFKDDIFTMEAKASAALACPAEMIRNTDYVLQLTERYTGLNVSSRLSEIVSKAMSIFAN